LDRSNEIGARYHISRFPTAVVVDKEEKILAYGHPQSASDLKQLLGRSLHKVLSKDNARKASIENRPEVFLTAGGSYDNQ
jgi:hypothetical protein